MELDAGEPLSKNEQKRRAKAELKAKQAAEKEAAKVCGRPSPQRAAITPAATCAARSVAPAVARARPHVTPRTCAVFVQAATAAAAPKAKAEKKTEDVEDLDPAAYYANRVAAMKALEDGGVSPYPHKFHCTTSIPDYVGAFGGIESGAHLEDQTVAVAGRLYFLRASSSKLQFYDLRADGAKVQIMMNYEVRAAVAWCHAGNLGFQGSRRSWRASGHVPANACAELRCFCLASVVLLSRTSLV